MSRGTSITDCGIVSKEITVREWVRHKLGSVAHENRVARVAEMLFELTGRWHELGRGECRLLTMAALVHDVGRAQGEEDHEKTGARLLMESAGLPLTDTERRRLAFLTRYHRGNVPEAGTERHLNHDHDDNGVMRTLLGLLRAADSLDSRSRGGPQLVATIHERVVNIYGYVAGDAAMAAATLGKPKKLKLLETVLGCQVRTEWFSMDRLALVS